MTRVKIEQGHFLLLCLKTDGSAINSADPDQIQHSVESDLGLHCSGLFFQLLRIDVIVQTCMSHHLCYNHRAGSLSLSVCQGQSLRAGLQRTIDLHINGAPENIHTGTEYYIHVALVERKI